MNSLNSFINTALGWLAGTPSVDGLGRMTENDDVTLSQQIIRNSTVDDYGYPYCPSDEESEECIENQKVEKAAWSNSKTQSCQA